MASHLERIILDETSCPKDRKFNLLASVQTRLHALSQGKLMSPIQHDETAAKFSVTLAAQHLHDWLLLQLELLDLGWECQIALEHASKPEYRIGQIVKHKVYNFRGVVVGWDPQPSVDVSRWDGLQHLSAEEIKKMPFYHVVPDPHDCTREFGAERGLRYVCQANLEVCPAEDTDIDVEFEDPEWTRETTDGVIGYKAPEQLLFKYGQDDDDDKTTERCMKEILHLINTWQCQGCSDSVPADSVASNLTLKNFMELLQISDCLEDATAVQETIKEIRKAHSRLDLRWQLERGITELMAGKGERTLEIFQAIVEDDPVHHNILF